MNIKPYKRNGYLMYLRKSRADAEAEARGEGETLARHESMLMAYASQNGLFVGDIYREVVSGETIANRPVMQQLLHEVENNLWDGVLVVEVERLARGDTIDQGIVAQAFKFSDTLIITPSKIYNPRNEFDEEYFEFGLFMSRREYKTINRRLGAGRMASVNSGKWVGNKSPYGYRRIKIPNDKGWTLELEPTESNIVKMIYELYTIGQKQDDGTLVPIGATKISYLLNELGYKTSEGNPWQTQTVSNLIRNPVYMGKIKWGARGEEKKLVDGEIVKSRPRKKLGEYHLVDGLHPSIISEETFYAAQKTMGSHSVNCNPVGTKISNPLAGLLVCKSCGLNMVGRPGRKNSNGQMSIICRNTSCDCASTYLHFLEDAVLDYLKMHLKKFKIQLAEHGSVSLVQSTANSDSRELKKSELAKLQSQMEKLHDLLEQGIYDNNTFLGRRNVLNKKIDEIESDIAKLEELASSEQEKIELQETIIPRIEHVIESYAALETAEQKNLLLRSVIATGTYYKAKGGRWKVAQDDFELELTLKV